jgi:hypothetical protein
MIWLMLESWNHVKEDMKAEVKTYDLYVRREVYGVIIEKITNCACCGTELAETIDSCWGFFGTDEAMAFIKEEGYTIEEFKEVN